MAYALDRLGWLQFEQLCTRLLELEAGVPQHDWAGSADHCRFAVTTTPTGPPLVPYELPGPVLVQCVWVRPGTGGRFPAAVDRLARQHPRELGAAGSFLLLGNAELAPGIAMPTSADRLPVGVLGARELGDRIDARAELRLAMPSLLGLAPLEDLVGSELAAASSLDRRAAHELAAVFVPTRAHARALQVLGEHHFAVLTGPPEMGKTAAARMIALAQLTAGWQAHECTTPDAVWQVFDPGCPQVFIADDAFGSTEYRADAAERWARAMERLLRSLDDRHWLIWTSRPAPLHAGLRRLHRERGAERFPHPARVLVDAGDLDLAEKTLILFRHAKAAALPDSHRHALRRYGAEIVANRHFTPERIRRLVARLVGGERNLTMAADLELSRPTEAMATSLQTLSIEHRDILVALLDAPPGQAINERELVAALRRHHDGSLTKPPAELVDRLADHFLRVSA